MTFERWGKGKAAPRQLIRQQALGGMFFSELLSVRLRDLCGKPHSCQAGTGRRSTTEGLALASPATHYGGFGREALEWVEILREKDVSPFVDWELLNKALAL